jgi:hypothetical protein
MDAITKEARYSWSISEKMGALQWIHKKDLIVDDYQRVCNNSATLRIARDFSWPAFGALTVAKRDGRFYVFNGQHRKAAADKRSDVEMLPCVVFESADKRGEAQEFLRSNVCVKPPTIVDRFPAMLQTEDRAASVVSELCQSIGRVVSTNAGPNSVSCVGKLRALAAKDPDRLRRIWPTISSLCDGKVLNVILVDALFYIDERLTDGETVANGRWLKRIREVGYDRMLDGARRAASLYSRGGPKQWAIGALEALNKGLHNKLGSHVLGSCEP